MTSKKDKQITFEVQLNWIAKKRGMLFSDEAEETIHVATPPVFGGEGKPWTPEHLFLSSISSCFMTTFLVFVEKTGFAINGFDCAAFGQIGIIEGKYKFTGIDLYPRVIINDESCREKAMTALEKTGKYCIISGSVNAPITYHSEIIVKEKTANELSTAALV